jgi:Zn-dependent protease
MERKEIQDILIAALALAVAFTIARTGGVFGIPSLSVTLVAISFISVSLGFILHELSHRVVANFYGAYAEFRMWKTGVIIALTTSLLGFIFAAPGAVYIHPKADMWGRVKSITKIENGIISIAGPVTNVLLALVFFLVNKIYPLGDIASYGVFINLWLGFFNMLPIPPLDGSKVFAWDVRVWLTSTVILGILAFNVF